MRLHNPTRRDAKLESEMARLYRSGRLCFSSVNQRGANVRSVEPQPEGQQQRVWSATINTPDFDEYESIIHTEGAQLDVFADNPIVYWDHGWMRDEPPIGSALSVTPVIDAINWRNNKLEAEWTVGNGFEPADTVNKLLEQKIVRKTSVAFTTLRSDFVRETAIVDGKEIKTDVYHIYEWRMFEFSPVGLPGNHSASIHHDDAEVLSYPSQKAEARAHAAHILAMRDKGVDIKTLQDAAAPLLALYDVDAVAIREGKQAIESIDIMLNVVDSLGKDGAEAAAVIASCLSAQE